MNIDFDSALSVRESMIQKYVLHNIFSLRFKNLMAVGMHNWMPIKSMGYRSIFCYVQALLWLCCPQAKYVDSIHYFNVN